ncbi:O-antigen ligase family protein [Patescibacteria group bacterium]|nr:O-antigen ligase family protein [Patescibacteria group bacterium]
MSEKGIRYVVNVIKGGLFVLPLLSLIVVDFLFFPFITGKNFFFRIMVEILFFLWVFVAVFDKKYRPKKSPLLIAVSATFFILVLATFFGENIYRSFWSNYERMEGLVGQLHLFAYFLILASVLRVKKDWKILFGAMIGVSFIATFYGFLQFFGKAAIHQSSTRLDATFGNATYLAIFIIFHLFLISLFFIWFRQKWIRISLGVLFALEALVMFLTATRGAILGFLGGLFLMGLLMAFLGHNKKLRYFFVGLLVAFVVVISLFLFIKDTSFVKENYVLSRFSSLSFSEQTVESRFTIWGMSIEGFKEHPILGWGPENYNLVFNKYFEPILYKQEPWFDRAHNVLFDWLITTGIIGFISYLSIFATAIYMSWRVWKSKNFKLLEFVLVLSLFGAYIFHNLFVFDNLTSYFVFFSVLGYIHFSWSANKKKEDEKEKRSSVLKDPGMGGYLAVTASFILVISSLYFANIKPMKACNTLLDALYLSRQTTNVDDVLGKIDEVIGYGTFGTGETREQLMSYANAVIGSKEISEENKIKVLTKAIEEMEKQVAKNPNDVRYLVMLGSIYGRGGRLEDAIKILDKAIELSPGKQQLYFVEADVYLSSGDKGKALGLLEKAYALENSNGEAINNLATLYIMNEKEKEAEDLLMEHYSSKVIANQKIVNAYAAVDNFEKVRDIWLLFIEQDPANAQHHVNLAATYLKLGEKELSISELEKAMELNPGFKEQAEYYINEIKEGRNP